MRSKILALKNKDWSLNKEWIEFLIISITAFVVPFILGHPQILVGIIVNLLLVKAAQSLSMSKIWPLIFLPSLGVISRGLLFTSLTPFLFYILPFIFMGNFLLVYSLKRLKTKNITYKLFIPSLVKALIIGSGAYIFITLGIIPRILLLSMSVWQFVHAFIAIIIFYTLFGIKNRFLLKK